MTCRNCLYVPFVDRLQSRSIAVIVVAALAGLAGVGWGAISSEERTLNTAQDVGHHSSLRVPETLALEQQLSEQCWDDVFGKPGIQGQVRAMTTYNGDLIVGGGFVTAGGKVVNRIARWDGSEWHPFFSNGEAGVNGWVYELTVYNGDLIAGGNFTMAGGQSVSHIARWDGSEWHPLVSGGQVGLDGGVSALTVWNGNLVAGGGFITAGGQTVNHIARWCGSAWHPFVSGGQVGVDGDGVGALTVWNGDLIAGGWYPTAGGQTVNSIARWDGSTWHPLNSAGEIGMNGGVGVLLAHEDDLFVGGWFSTAGGQTVNRIARWDGSEWHPFVSGGQVGVDGGVIALTVWNGDLVVGGSFTTAGDQTVNRIARWDFAASQWFPFTTGGANGLIGTVHVLLPYDGKLAVGGYIFATAGWQAVNHLAMWDPDMSVWHQFDSGMEYGLTGSVRALTMYNGDLIAGGFFLSSGGEMLLGIGRWDANASHWQPFASGGQIGMGDSFPPVLALAVYNSDLIAGGMFTTAGGQLVNHIARWDGVEWHPIGTGGQVGMNGEVRALTVYNDELIIGGDFTTVGGKTINRIVRWDGSTWRPLGFGTQNGTSGPVNALAVWNGALIVGGSFSTAGGVNVNRVARWDGLQWHTLEAGGQIGVNGAVSAITVHHGNLIVGGWFTTAGGQTVNRIARWDDGAWHPFVYDGQVGVGGVVGTSSYVKALTSHQDDLFVGGRFVTAGGQQMNHIARWDGASWSPLTMDGEVGISSQGWPEVSVLLSLDEGLLVGGAFLAAGGKVVSHLTQWAACDVPLPTCPGDINDDGVVNGFDLVDLLSCWGSPIPGCEAADINGDDVVNGFDLVDLLAAWGPCP